MWSIVFHSNVVNEGGHIDHFKKLTTLYHALHF